MEKPLKRVLISDSAKDVVKHLRNKHGDLLFHISGGCCDGTQPQCYEVGDFRLGSIDVKIGEVAKCGVYMSQDQFEYFKYAQLTIDIAPGKGGGFSLEVPLGLRFTLRSRTLAIEELANLADTKQTIET